MRSGTSDGQPEGAAAGAPRHSESTTTSASACQGTRRARPAPPRGRGRPPPEAGSGVDRAQSPSVARPTARGLTATAPWPAEPALNWSSARAARGRRSRPRPARSAVRARDRPGRHRGVQRAEDLRPAAVRAARQLGRRGHPAREVHGHRAPGCTWSCTCPGPAGSAGAPRCRSCPPRPSNKSPHGRPGAPRRRLRASTSPRPAPRSGWPCTSCATRRGARHRQPRTRPARRRRSPSTCSTRSCSTPDGRR